MSEALTNHEEGVDKSLESPMASLAEEADNFDPEQAMEARAEREASMAEDESEKVIDRSEDVDEGLYSREYRERMNTPTSDLFTRRRVVMEEQFPALKPLSPEEIRRYVSDKSYQEKVDRARSEVPREVTEEHDLLGRMINRLDDGVNADLTPDHPWASSEPNYIPTEIEEEGYGTMVVTTWKAGHSKQDLARMRELHEKNSEIIDFSHEGEIDIDSVPEELQEKIESLTGEVEALKMAELQDFSPSGNNRPKTSEVYDKISELSKVDNLSYTTRKEIRRRAHEFRKQYMEARDAAELRDIDVQIVRLQQEKAKVEERQKKYMNAGFVSRLFSRLFDPRRAEREQGQASYIDDRMEELARQARRLRGEK